MTWRETNVGYSFAFDETKTHLRAFFNKKTTLLTHYRPLNWLKYSKIIRQGTSVKEKLTTYTEVYKSHDKYILRLLLTGVIKDEYSMIPSRKPNLWRGLLQDKYSGFSLPLFTCHSKEVGWGRVGYNVGVQCCNPP